jgi:phosphatidylethanolamine-binding protein (PEBP) family uncharacterized protein
VHKYEFTVWAMPTPHFDVAPDANAKALSAQLQKTALGHATLTGTVSG